MTPTVLLVNKDSAAICDLRAGNYEVYISLRTSYHGYAAVLRSGCLFVFGGQKSPSGVCKLDLEAMAWGDMAWEDMASMPTGRRGDTTPFLWGSITLDPYPQAPTPNGGTCGIWR